jgi:hypothetical protein
VVRGNDWSDLAAEDERLTIATTRILRLKAAGLTMEMVAFDFLRRRIAPFRTGEGQLGSTRTQQIS